jgi:hypothetical protein
MKQSFITAALALATLALFQALTSCAPGDFNSVKISAITPYGDLSSTDGQVSLAVRPLVIATK